MEITEEEKNALKNYSMYSHVQINAMINYNPELLDELSDLYHLDFSKENVENYIEEIKKMYSAMYKYTKNNTHDATVYRGTSRREALSLSKCSEYNQLLSTSTDYKVANNFAANHYTVSPARLDIDMNDAVYIYMPYALDGDSDKETIDEKEILIAPFSKIESVENGLSFGGVLKEGNLQSYRVKISKNDFKDVPNINNLSKEKIIEGYSTLPDIAKNYFEIKQKMKQLELYHDNNWDKTMSDSYYTRTKKSYTEELKNIQSQISSITSNMQTYLKASFRDIEKEIDKTLVEEKEIKSKETSKDDIQKFKNAKEYNVSKINSLLEEITGVKDNLKIEGIEDLKSIGIDISDTSNDLNNFKNKLDTLAQNLIKIKEDIEKFTLNENITPDEFNIYNNKISSQYESISHIQASMNYISKMLLPSVMSKHISDLNAKVQDKILEKINESEISYLDNEISKSKKTISSPLSIFGGKKKIANAMIEFCNAKKENILLRNDLGNCNTLKSAKSFLNSHPENENLASFINQIENLPKKLYLSNYDSIYQFTNIPENADLDTIESNTFAEKTKSKDATHNHSSFRDSLSNHVANRDIDMQIDSLNSLVKTIPKFSKEERRINSIDMDISDLLGEK